MTLHETNLKFRISIKDRGIIIYILYLLGYDVPQ